MNALILARHAQAASNVRSRVDGVPPGEGLTPLGREQALRLRSELAGEPFDLGVCTAFRRTRETLELVLGGGDVPVLVVEQLNEIRFGAFEGRPLEEYRAWAWASGPSAACPGDGESRAQAARRFAEGLLELAARAEATVLAVAHALPLRYILDAAAGVAPRAQVEPVPHAVPYRLGRDEVEGAARLLRGWAGAPSFSSTPIGGCARAPGRR